MTPATSMDKPPSKRGQCSLGLVSRPAFSGNLLRRPRDINLSQETDVDSASMSLRSMGGSNRRCLGCKEDSRDLSADCWGVANTDWCEAGVAYCCGLCLAA